jgi:hypothetical protein
VIIISRFCHLLMSIVLSCLSFVAQADEIRIAHYNVGLDRDGPGLLLQDIQSGSDEQIIVITQIIQHINPQVLALNGFDIDTDLVALRTFQDVLKGQGVNLPYLYAPMQNSGVPSNLDLDRDGRFGESEDNFGYGDFRGQSAMALLSAFPFSSAPLDFTSTLWRDLPNAEWPVLKNGQPFFSDEIISVLPVHSVGAWDVKIETPKGALSILMSHSTPPVFDGPENANGIRNKMEILFWQNYLETKSGHFVMALGLNADPYDGDGATRAVQALLSNSKLQDPAPTSIGAERAFPESKHQNPSNQDTVDWREPRPGNLRVDYILPSSGLTVRNSGVFWPVPENKEADWVEQAQSLGTRHKLVWIDLSLPD